ncbi:MAG: alkaline phosphatase family protein, partial [Polyangiaceae bacterium]
MRFSRLAFLATTALLGCSSSAPQDDAQPGVDGGVMFPTDGGVIEDAPAPPLPDGAACTTTPVAPDPLADKRATCVFTKGAKVADTLGITDAQRAALPITHIIVVTQENRSFDHYFGELSKVGVTDAEGWPLTFTNPDLANKPVAPMHAPSTCLIGDPPHQGAAMVKAWNNGQMNGFVKAAAINGSNGYYAMSYYDHTDIPFYYWMASTFA